MRFGIGPLLLCLAAAVAAGVVHGVQTDRWGSSSRLEEALGRLPHLPANVGDWRGESAPHDEEASRSVGVKGVVARRYTNPHTREAVSTLVVCGRGGPISVHTPDQCYVRSGYPQLTALTVKEIEAGGRKHAFKTARFGKPGIGSSQMEIYWGWSRDGLSWEAPENTRLAFARLPALYKIYVVRYYAAGSREENATTCEEFLRRALPEFGAALAPPG